MMGPLITLWLKIFMPLPTQAPLGVQNQLSLAQLNDTEPLVGSQKSLLPPHTQQKNMNLL